MALRLGTENRRQVYLVVGLFSIVFLGAAWELKDYFFGAPSTPLPPTPAQVAKNGANAGSPSGTSSASAGQNKQGTKTQGTAAQKLSNEGIDPTLHLERLAQSEDVEYEGTGRNIFSAESAPVVIPEAVKSARILDANVTTPPPPPPAPTAPPIDLKYFGYTQSSDKALKAFFVHGDDVFMAKTGEIVDHRYKVGAIGPGSVQVTDLSYNSTQTLQMKPN
jgi:hypothetical protein